MGDYHSHLQPFLVSLTRYPLSRSLFTSARLVSVSAKEGYTPQMFARLHLTRKTPARALALQAVVSFL